VRAVEPVLAYGGFWMIVDEAHISTIAVHPKWRGVVWAKWACGHDRCGDGTGSRGSER